MNVISKKSHTINTHTNYDQISNDLILECKLCNPGTRLSKSVRDKLSRYFSIRKQLSIKCTFKKKKKEKNVPKIDWEFFTHISLPKDARKEIVSRLREGCAPLFVVCKRGNLEIVEFLISVCGADIEQRGLFENPEDQSVLKFNIFVIFVKPCKNAKNK